MSMVKCGFYRHYKGGLYFVLGTVKHSETQEELVLYYSLHYFCFWARPEAMWNDMIDRAIAKKHVRNLVPRFEKISFLKALTLLRKKSV